MELRGEATHFRAASGGTKSYIFIYDLGASYSINEVMLEGYSTGHWGENGELGMDRVHKKRGENTYWSN